MTLIERPLGNTGVHPFLSWLSSSDWLLGAHRGLLMAPSVPRDSGEHRALRVTGCFLFPCHTPGSPHKSMGLGVTLATRPWEALSTPHHGVWGQAGDGAAAVQRMSRSEPTFAKEAGA